LEGRQNVVFTTLPTSPANFAASLKNPSIWFLLSCTNLVAEVERSVRAGRRF